MDKYIYSTSKNVHERFIQPIPFSRQFYIKINKYFESKHVSSLNIQDIFIKVIKSTRHMTNAIILGRLKKFELCWKVEFSWYKNYKWNKANLKGSSRPKCLFLTVLSIINTIYKYFSLNTLFIHMYICLLLIVC